MSVYAPHIRATHERLSADEMRAELVATVHAIHRRGWSPGTGGNYGTVLARDPLRLLMSPSGYDKGKLRADDLLVVDGRGEKISGPGTPSAETALHIAIVRHTGAACVLHTHSVWNTLLSGHYGAHADLEIHGYEMLKGLSGVPTHEYTERVPILPNSQDIPHLARLVEHLLSGDATLHGFLLENHGLYTWGNSIGEANRHVETLEFLFEVLGRKLSLNHRSV